MTLSQIVRKVGRHLFPADPGPDPFPEDAWTDPAYGDWFRLHRATESELDAQRHTFFRDGVLFSIVVPLFHTPLGFLTDMVDSVIGQTYSHFELVLVNASPEDKELAAKVSEYCQRDARVRCIPLAKNRGIAENTNEGIAAARGEFVCFLDHDDTLEPNALYEYAKAIGENHEIDMLYCDEDLIEEDSKGQLRHMHPFFKPAYSPEALLCTNYILHFLTIRKGLLDEISRAGSLFDGTQDYRNILSVIRKTDRVHHVSKVLYHWRICESSTAANPDAKPYDRIAARRSIGWYIASEYPDARVIGSGIVNTQNLWFRPSKDKSVVSVIVDGRGVFADLPGFLELFQQTNSYNHVEVIVVSEESIEGDSAKSHVNIHTVPASFSRFACFNAGAREAKGVYLVFMDAGSSFQSAEPLEQMLGLCKREGVGVVAPKTLYADGSVRCYGVAVTPERIMPLYRGFPDDFPGYQCNTRGFQNNSAASYLGLMTPRSLFEEVGGFDERFEGEIGTADYCRRVLNAGKRIVQTCTVKVQSDERAPKLHYDNKTNAPDFASADLARFDEKWPDVRALGDPYFNCNFDQSSSYFQIAQS